MRSEPDHAIRTGQGSSSNGAIALSIRAADSSGSSTVQPVKSANNSATSSG